MPSRLETFIRNRADELQYRPDDAAEEQKKVTVRLPVSLVDHLDEVAGKLSMSRTSCAEELMLMAIDEAYVRVTQDPYLQGRQGIKPSLITRIADEEEDGIIGTLVEINGVAA